MENSDPDKDEKDSCKASAKRPLDPSTNDTWIDEDDHFAAMFHPWDEYLPLSKDCPDETLLSTLHRLESLIPPFEEAIGHSEAGFQKWIERHQRAMEGGIAPIPAWPSLLTTTKKLPEPHWSDIEWTKRYSYLVAQRIRLVGYRLARVRLPSGKLRKIFGENKGAADLDSVRRAAYDSHCKNWYSRVLPESWYESVDELLDKRNRYEDHNDSNVFWGVNHYPKKEAEGTLAGEFVIKLEASMR